MTNPEIPITFSIEKRVVQIKNFENKDVPEYLTKDIQRVVKRNIEIEEEKAFYGTEFPPVNISPFDRVIETKNKEAL